MRIVAVERASYLKLEGRDGRHPVLQRPIIRRRPTSSPLPAAIRLPPPIGATVWRNTVDHRHGRCLTLAKWETVSGQFGGYFTFSHDDKVRLLPRITWTKCPSLLLDALLFCRLRWLISVVLMTVSIVDKVLDPLLPGDQLSFLRSRTPAHGPHG
jgi:hypothetical protein